MPGFGLLAAALAGSSCTPRGEGPARPEPLSAVLMGYSFSPGYNLMTASLQSYTKASGVPVRFVPAPQRKPERLEQYLAWLRAGAAAPDVYQADITEIGRLAEHMIDLRPFLAQEAQEQIPEVMAHYEIGGRLVALPLYTDVAVLIYRTDLLADAGYRGPPRSWDELEEMAARIQARQRAAGHEGFWGFAWPGKADDDLLCFALELQATHGGGGIVDPDGTVTVNNPRARAALLRARRWIGRISPRGITAYSPADAGNLWYSGQAAFFRTWPHAYAVSQEPSSPIRGKVALAALPSGGAGHFGTLGGWQLSVSRHSARPRQAAELVRSLVRREEQRARAVRLSGLPPRLDLYEDPEVLRANPFFPQVRDILLQGAVARPTRGAGRAYEEVAAAYIAAVHAVLEGQAEPAPALDALERRLRALLAAAPPHARP
ncbi:MAG TPA: extracellular solute-binding protein [Vicinamibacteria bacterium]